jgi:acetyl-CoA C-acetyltransferase
MTNTPHYLPSARGGIRYGDSTIVEGIARDGLLDAYDKIAMGIFADETAEENSITREQQDEFAINSYQRAIDATNAGLLKDEIIPVEVPQGRKLPPVVVEKDEEIGKFNPEKLKKLNAAFTTNGTVTAGNASSINDGAAALVLVSQAKYEQLKLQGSAFKIVSFADGAHQPQRFTTAPSIAVPKALTRAGLDASQIDFYEINEAFSAVALANSKILNLDQDKVNVFGGAVGIGHPLGCSGARILVTLCNVLNKKGGKYGCAAVCNGGGGASSLIVEKI